MPTLDRFASRGGVVQTVRKASAKCRTWPSRKLLHGSSHAASILTMAVKQFLRKSQIFDGYTGRRPDRDPKVTAASGQPEYSGVHRNQKLVLHEIPDMPCP